MAQEISIQTHAAVARIRYWIWAAQDQAQLYRELFDVLQQMRLAGDLRSATVSRLHGRQSAANHFLLIATRNLIKAIDAADDEVRPAMPEDLRKSVTMLRDLYEHWEKEEARFYEQPPTGSPGASGRQYRKQHPDKSPWSRSWSLQDGHTLGGIVSLGELETLLAEIEAALPPPFVVEEPAAGTES